MMPGLFPGVCESSLNGDAMLGYFLIVEFLMFKVLPQFNRPLGFTINYLEVYSFNVALKPAVACY